MKSFEIQDLDGERLKVTSRMVTEIDESHETGASLWYATKEAVIAAFQKGTKYNETLAIHCHQARGFPATTTPYITGFGRTRRGSYALGCHRLDRANFFRLLHAYGLKTKKVTRG